MKKRRKISKASYILLAHKRQFLVSCFYPARRQRGCRTFPSNMLPAQSVRRKNTLSIPIVWYSCVAYWAGPVAPRQFAGSYDNASYTTIRCCCLAFRQRRGIAARIEAIGIERQADATLRVPSDPRRDPNNVSGKRPCCPVARLIN